MKKFSLLALMAVLLGCFSAKAVDYYLIGGFNGWKEADATCKFVAQGDGTFVLNYNGTLTSGFKVNDGTWKNDNVNFGSNGNDLVVGTPYKYAVKGGNIAITEAVANPKVTLNPTAGTLLVEGQQAQVVTTYDIWGMLTSSNWGSTTLTENATTKKWEASNVTVSYASAEFGLRKLDNGNQSSWFAASNEVTVSATTTLTLVDADTKNIKIAAGTYDFSFDPSNKQLVITKQGGSDNPPTPPTPPTSTGFGLVGTLQTPNPWTIGSPIEMTAGENNTYTITFDTLEAGTEFKVATLGKGWDDTFGAEGPDGDAPIDVTVGTEMNAWVRSSHNYKIVKDLTDVTITFTYATTGASKLLVEGTEEGGTVTPPPTPGTFKVYFDNFNNWSATAPHIWAWNADGDITENWPGPEMTLVEGETTLYVWESERIPTGIIFTNDKGDKAGADNIENPVNGATYYSDGSTTKPEEGQMKVAIVGAFNSWSGSANATTEIVDNCATFIIENYQNSVEGQGSGFKFTINGAGWYGLPEGSTVANGEWYTCTAGANNILLPAEAENKTVKFVFAVDTYSFSATWTPGSGIEGIFNDVEDAEYYTVNGIRVNNPANGIFIVRKNGKTYKVVR